LSANLVLLNANIRTMNLCQPVAQAVAMAKNKIVKVGSNQEISPLIGKGTKVVNLEGKTVVPGLIDTHIHVTDFGRCLIWLDLTGAQSIAELQNIVKEKAKQTPLGKWIIGRGWNHNRFIEKRLLNLGDLDEVAPDNPVILYHEAAMWCAINSKALDLAGLTKQTAIHSGGSIDKNPHTGEFTGILRDAAINLVWQVIPEPTIDELSEATAIACQEIVKAGLTSVHWIVLSENELAIIQQLHAEGRLPFRVNVIVPEEFIKQIIDLRSTDSLLLHFGGIVIYADGYLDSKTAALIEPYSDDQNNRGKLLYPEPSLTSSVAGVLAAGFQPIIHAMGDKAVDTALNVIEQASKHHLDKSTRFRIEQAANLNEDFVERLKNQQVAVSVQPRVIATEFAVWSATEHLGVERAKWLHPLKTLIKAGVKVAGGSDCPMEPLSPLLGIQEAVSRQVFSEQQLTVEEALRMYTADAAYSSNEDKIKGSIEVGKLADLTVLLNDPVTFQTDKIKEISIEMTIIDGKVVYSKS
jgi:predicted amidohydrolase YtcJ